MKRLSSILLLLAVASSSLYAQTTAPASTQQAHPRWVHDGVGISWLVRPGSPPHRDNIETAGERCALILTYGRGPAGQLINIPHVVWPTLRTLPNNTHGSLQFTFTPDHIPTLLIDGKALPEHLTRAHLDGLIHLNTQAGPLTLRRTWLAGSELPLAIERLTIANASSQPVTVALAPPVKTHTTDAAKGVQGAYLIEAIAQDADAAPLAPGASREMTIYYTARPAAEPLKLPVSAANEQWRRETLVRSLRETLVFDAPDEDVSTMFAFAKVRAAESLFRTKGGLVHSPGGRSYYAAIWANDQAEYANPLFGYLGHAPAREAAETSFAWFAKYMNPDYNRIPSSIIAEGISFWNGAKDRGDMAMLAYGASRYALATGDRGTAAKLWPLIDWCLEYLNRQITPAGVIASDSDELEGRFPAGKANLNTAGLTYDALLSSAALANDLGHPERASTFTSRATALRTAIESYFGADVEGFATYRYYDGNDVLRAWIATPLTVGIYDRAPGTLDALFSPRLWTADGLATQAGKPTFWDRATLYGFRGAFAAGEVDRAWPRFTAYTQRRLRGEHVPYPVEAYPEGNQRHLSAESALYVRAITEGLFGLRPIGLRKITLQPRLPAEWASKSMALRNLKIAGATLDIVVDTAGCHITGNGQARKTFPLGQPITLDFSQPW